MKKMVFLVLSVFCVLMSSCDPEPPIYIGSSAIVGVWEWTEAYDAASNYVEPDHLEKLSIQVDYSYTRVSDGITTKGTYHIPQRMWSYDDEEGTIIFTDSIGGSITHSYEHDPYRKLLTLTQFPSDAGYVKQVWKRIK